MRLRWNLIILVGAVAAALAFGEFVMDMRIPHASLAETHAVTTAVQINMADYQRDVERMKQKYGSDAETMIVTRPPRVVTKVHDRVVEEKSPIYAHFAHASGLFVIGPRGRPRQTFPFEIDPLMAPPSGRQGQPSVQLLKNKFEERLGAKFFDFDDRDAAIDTCVTIAPADLGRIGPWLQFKGSVFCVVLWKGPAPGSMLIGVALADADPWMRPFSRRICRWLTATALGRLASKGREAPPDYAACLLADRPYHTAAADTLEVQTYEIRRDATLSYIR